APRLPRMASKFSSKLIGPLPVQCARRRASCAEVWWSVNSKLHPSASTACLSYFPYNACSVAPAERCGRRMCPLRIDAAPIPHGFERYALEISLLTTIQAAAAHLGVSWDVIKEIQKS